MSITRAEALNQMIELRDFAEQWESDMKPRVPPGSELTFVCLYFENRMGKRPITLHAHITADLLNHCVAGLEDSIRILADENARDIKAMSDTLRASWNSQPRKGFFATWRRTLSDLFSVNW
jgi:hypothetical protein